MSEVISEFREKFTETEKSFGDITHPVWFGGNGPPVILMHELDGFIPAFMQLAIRLSESFTIYTPVFYGKVGERFSGLTAYFCMRREFEVFRLGKTSPIVGWIRDLAADIHRSSGAKGVGVVGMCMTGGIVLATISHPSVAAGVAAQPSLPLTTGLPLPLLSSRRRKEDIGMDPHDIQAAADSGTPVLTLRYGNDPICPIERIKSIIHQLPSAKESPDFLENKFSHPTLTDSFRKKESTDIWRASDQAISHTTSFLRERLS